MRFKTAIDLLSKAATKEDLRFGPRQWGTLKMHDGGTRRIPFIKHENKWDVFSNEDLKLMRLADVVTLDDGTVLKNRYGPSSYD